MFLVVKLLIYCEIVSLSGQLDGYCFVHFRSSEDSTVAAAAVALRGRNDFELVLSVAQLAADLKLHVLVLYRFHRERGDELCDGHRLLDLSPHLCCHVRLDLHELGLVRRCEYLGLVHEADSIKTQFIAVCMHLRLVEPRKLSVLLDLGFLVENRDLKLVPFAFADLKPRLGRVIGIAFDNWLDVHAVEEDRFAIIIHGLWRGLDFHFLVHWRAIPQCLQAFGELLGRALDRKDLH